MIEIPDVNVLIALHTATHEFHAAASKWFADTSLFATTPTTEAGFVRLVMQPKIVGVAVSSDSALTALSKVKAQPHAVFLPDTVPLDTSYFWYAVSGPKQITDIHLLDIAKSHNGKLVSFDHKLLAALKPGDRRYVRVLGFTSTD